MNTEQQLRFELLQQLLTNLPPHQAMEAVEKLVAFVLSGKK